MGPDSGVTIRPELGQGYLEIDLMSLAQGYVGFELMPLLTTAREAGVYPKVELKELLPKVTLVQLRRGPDGSYPRSTWVYGSDNFTTEEFGLEEPVDDRQARILGNHGIEADQIASDRSTTTLMRAIEQGIQDIVYDDTTYSSQETNVEHEWDDPTNAVPIDNVKAGVEAFEDRNGGIKPNVLVMNLRQARNCLLTDQVQAVIGYRPTEGLSQEQLLGNLQANVLAQALGFPGKVVIADGFKNSNLPGVAGSYSRIWGDEHIAMVRVAQGQDLKQPTFGRVVAWTGDGGGDGQSIVIEDYYDQRVRGRVIRARVDLELKVVHSELLQILGNITTA